MSNFWGGGGQSCLQMCHKLDLLLLPCSIVFFGITIPLHNLNLTFLANKEKSLKQLKNRLKIQWVVMQISGRRISCLMEHNAPGLANAADPARWGVKQNAALTSFNFLVKTLNKGLAITTQNS